MALPLRPQRGRPFWPTARSGLRRNRKPLADAAASGLEQAGPPVHRTGRAFKEGRCEMQYVSRYRSPLGAMLLAADDAGLTGAWFEGQKYFARGLDRAGKAGDLPVFSAAREWLDRYFSGRDPGRKNSGPATPWRRKKREGPPPFRPGQGPGRSTSAPRTKLPSGRRRPPPEAWRPEESGIG